MVNLDSTCGSVNQNNVLGIMKKDPKVYIILGLFLYILFLQNCSDHSEVVDDITTEVQTDTTRITVVDTVQFVDTVIRNVIVKVSEPVIINDSVNEYTNTFSDSLIDGAIWARVRGDLLDLNFDYTPKFPKFIIQTDTVIINTHQTTTIKKNSFSLNAGIEVGGSVDQFNFSPIVGFTTKRDNSYFYRYGVLDKTHNIGLMYNFKINK